MKRISRCSMVSAAGLALAYVGVARAAEEQPNRPGFERHRAQLLDRFGDQGIDADGDGVLTHEEARAFFAQRREEVGDFWPGGRRPGRRGLGGHRGEGMHRFGMVLHHLELLEADAPPVFFDLAKHPEADQDGDGELSEEEWQAFAEAKRAEILARIASHHPKADADGDGTISNQELEAMKAKFNERLLRRHPEADTDGDGVLSPEEASAFRAAKLEEHRALILERHPEADLDGDGILSDAEMHEFLADWHGPRDPNGHRGHDCFGPEARGRRGPGNAVDRRARILQHHPEADLDGDGTLSDEEIEAFRGSRGRGHRGQGKGHHHGWKPGCSGSEED